MPSGVWFILGPGSRTSVQDEKLLGCSCSSLFVGCAAKWERTEGQVFHPSRLRCFQSTEKQHLTPRFPNPKNECFPIQRMNIYRFSAFSLRSSAKNDYLGPNGVCPTYWLQKPHPKYQASCSRTSLSKVQNPIS